MTVKEHNVEEIALEPSAEIQKLMTRFYEAISTGDFESLDRLVSQHTGLRWIGSDPDEWWEDRQAVLKAWRAERAEMGSPASITGGGPTAYQHGDVAWVSDRPAFHLPDGRTLPFRFTAVWLREPQGWRIVQAHASFGVANEAVLRTA
jgi:ketosteroid isomerase-like protein